MKIEQMVPSLPAAGMEMVVARLTRGLRSRGHDVGITCLIEKGPIGEALEAEGFRVSVVSSPGARTILWPERLREWLVRLEPDVVHIHTGAWLKSARAARLARVPRILFTMHGKDGRRPWHEPFTDRLAALHTDVTVAVSDALIPYLRKRAGVPMARVRVVGNGVDTRRFHPGPRTGRVRQACGLSGDAVVIGHVARFTPVKNHSMLVEAAARVIEARPWAFFALIGDGPLRADTETQVDRLGIRHRIGFLGHLSDLPDVYRDLDVLVLPSFSEAASISLLEGMASGVPVVATAVGGTPGLLGHGDSGILVPSGDAAALAAALIGLIDEPAERTRLGQAARHRVETLYSLEAMVGAYESLYEMDG